MSHQGHPCTEVTEDRGWGWQVRLVIFHNQNVYRRTPLQIVVIPFNFEYAGVSYITLIDSDKSMTPVLTDRISMT